MNDKDQLLLRKAGFDDLPSALAAIEAMSIEVHQLLNEVNTLRKERDEARRAVCFLTVFDPEVSHLNYEDSEREEARSRGWDCFKDT
jgi:hypothetical protein